MDDQMPINSKQKGARAEREFSKWMMENLGCEARRGQQFSGGTDSPDVVHSLPNLHVEVKMVERLNIHDAIAQAKQDANGKVPIVAHRRNRSDWLITVEASQLKDLAKIVIPA